MNWKLFITACVSGLMISFPQNIIGCGAETDPYDYYISLFHNNLPDAKGFQPFYYTGYNFLYDETEPASVSELLSEEWSAYCGSPVKAKDAWHLVNHYALKDLNNLYFHIEKNQPLKIPDSVSKNEMTKFFIRQKDLEALGYILYSKKIEPFTYGGHEEWPTPERDSLKMAKLIRDGQQLRNAANKDFFKLKYSYQVLRLALYSGRYEELLKWYDDYQVAAGKSSELLPPLCLALKAGALFRTGQRKESAYLFSRVFATTRAKRISNYLSFSWSINRQTDRNDYLSLCKNNAEKADMLGLFALNSTADEGATLKEIYSLAPAADILEVLAVREVNKGEEKYLTPVLNQQAGGLSFNNYYLYPSSDSTVREVEKGLKGLSAFMHQVAQDGKHPHAGLFETVAAYTAYMTRDYAAANQYMDAAEKMNLTAKAKDQLMLTRLVVSISEQSTIDSRFEEKILPALQWLQKKAKEDKPVSSGYWNINQWADFYRNVLAEVLAKRYHAQKDLQKETLCIGAAAKLNDYMSVSPTSFLRDKLQSADVEKLYTLMNSPSPGPFEKFLLGNNTLTREDVVDFAGTAYLRENKYDKAIEWFNKAGNNDKIKIRKNPFADLLYDQEEQLKAETNYTTTKLLFAQEMKKLLGLAESDKVNNSKYFYKYALGLYNTTYYGHTWELVEYYRSGSDGYHVPKDANAYQEEYYTARSAEQYFEKAMNASADKNFKARCLFMMAKCSQKQVHQPQYTDYTGDNYWDKMEADTKLYWPQFKHNKYFARFVKEYGSTPFYQQAYKSCSYLRDFVRKK